MSGGTSRHAPDCESCGLTMIRRPDGEWFCRECQWATPPPVDPIIEESPFTPSLRRTLDHEAGPGHLAKARAALAATEGPPDVFDRR